MVFLNDAPTGLRAIVAIHSTRLGPALGGTRFYPYADEDDAFEDVVRLSRGMTYKAATAGLDLGGGKAVVMGDPSVDKSEALMRAYGRYVDSLGGRYITAEDVGTTQADMDVIRGETRFVTGVSLELGGSGDPSAATARGVLAAMRAVAEHLWGSGSLAGRHVAVTGVGKVGSNLVRGLVAAGAEVTVADVTSATVQRVVGSYEPGRVRVADAATVHRTHCDIFSPCALGGVLDPQTIAGLNAAAVVGSANNQLADSACATLLARAGVLYAPDYVVNAGGLVNIADELTTGGYHPDRAMAAVDRIHDTTASVLAIAEAEGLLTVEAADRLAERRLNSVDNVGPVAQPAGLPGAGASRG